VFAGYYFADQVQRYRASPHKPRIDHVAQALITHEYLREVMAQHLREWLRFTADCDVRGIVLPQTVHAPEVQEYVARRLPRGSASRRRFVRASVRIFLETDTDGAVCRAAWVRVPGGLGLRTGLMLPPDAANASYRHVGVITTWSRRTK
jgi:hypothetical protein